jgi:hypothetical protein
VNPQDPLAALHPLREPTAIGWWPLAPGWWVLIAVAILATAILFYYLMRRYQANAYRRLALKQLHAIQECYANSARDDKCLQNTASDSNALLKSVALRVFPRHDIAALSGQAWMDFLNKTRRSESVDTEFSTAFTNAAYLPKAPDLDAEQLFRACQNWINKHRAAA